MTPSHNDSPDSDAQQLDATGLTCPLPVLRAQRALRGMKAGDKLELLSTDEVSLKEVPLFCEQAGHELLEGTTDAQGIHRFVILKGHPADS